MEHKKEFFRNVDKLLLNEKFISWRLFKTKELEEYWKDFIINKPHLEKALEEAIIQFNEVKINQFQISDLEKEQIFININKKIKQCKKRRLAIRAGYVAAVMIIGIFSTLFFWEVRKSKQQYSPESMDVIVGQALPEEDIYILSNGVKIRLNDKSHIGLKDNGKAVITDSTESTKDLILATTELNKLVVPFGKRTNLTLSDGTVVWLNSGTQLDFPSEFKGKSREIFVDGEIYIDIATDKKKPFIVHAGNMNITVMGTSFNLSAYKDDISKSVVLVNGKVQIETDNNYKTDLEPNEKIEINYNSITKEFVDVSEYVSWKDGLLEFNSTPMSEILKKIGRYYNVEFEKTQDLSLNEKTFSGKLFLSNNLDSVMLSISALSSTKYLRKENKIFIIKK